MRNARFGLLGLVAVALVVPVGVAQESAPWFDVENCAICRNLSAEEGLMDNVEWESHKIANGMLSISVIPQAYEAAFERAHKNMDSTIQKLQQGEAMHLCGFCTNYGKLAMSGARMEEIKTHAGRVSLITSDDPAVIAMIHEHAQRTIEEHARWQKERKAKVQAQK